MAVSCRGMYRVVSCCPHPLPLPYSCRTAIRGLYGRHKYPANQTDTIAHTAPCTCLHSTNTDKPCNKMTTYCLIIYYLRKTQCPVYDSGTVEGYRILVVVTNQSSAALEMEYEYEPLMSMINTHNKCSQLIFVYLIFINTRLGLCAWRGATW